MAEASPLVVTSAFRLPAPVKTPLLKHMLGVCRELLAGKAELPAVEAETLAKRLDATVNSLRDLLRTSALTDGNVILDFAADGPLGNAYCIRRCAPVEVAPVKFLSALEFEKKHGKYASAAFSLLRAGKIPGAVKVGNRWQIPVDAPWPAPEVAEEEVPEAKEPRSKFNQVRPLPAADWGLRAKQDKAARSRAAVFTLLDLADEGPVEEKKPLTEAAQIVSMRIVVGEGRV